MTTWAAACAPALDRPADGAPAEELVCELLRDAVPGVPLALRGRVAAHLAAEFGVVLATRVVRGSVTYIGLRFDPAVVGDRYPSEAVSRMAEHFLAALAHLRLAADEGWATVRIGQIDGEVRARWRPDR